MAKCIEFKVKPYKIIDGETERSAFNYKKEITRADCNLKNSDHTYYNSDLFPAILNRAYKKIIGEYRKWSFIDDLPDGVTIDTTKFMAVVTINLPDTFK